MTLIIYNRITGENHEFHYQDAIVEGDYVRLGRNTPRDQIFWFIHNVDIAASENDHIYVVMPDGRREETRQFYGYRPRR
jgi:hypothetical protein